MITCLFILTGGILVLVTIGFAISPLTNFVPVPVLKCIVISAGISLLVYLTWKHSILQMYTFAALLLVFRIGFNWFILPSREQSDKASVCRDRAIEIANKYKPDQLRFIKSDKLPVHTIYYLAREWEKPVRTADEPSTDGYYIIYEPEFSGHDYIKIEEFPSTEMDKIYSIVRFPSRE
jgi:energy-converting hydrogenase Eha subunit E